MTHHAKRSGLAFLALGLGLLSGCGGESGGLPSGIGGALQGVKIRTNLLSLSVSSNVVSEDGSILPEVVAGIAKSGTGNNPTKSFRIRLKGASISSQDVLLDAQYLDAGATDKFDDRDLASAAQAPGGAVSLDARRCYIFDPDLAAYDLPKPTGVTGNVSPFLIRVADPEGDRPDLDAGNRGTFEYAGFPLAKSDARKAVVDAYLAELNGVASAGPPVVAADPVKALAAQKRVLGATGVPSIAPRIVQYAPSVGIPLRRGTFDVAIEFYTKDSPTAANQPPAPGQTPEGPFFVTFLKAAAAISTTDVTIKPAGIAGDPAYDPTRRFAKPALVSVPYEGVPANAGYVRITIREVDTQLSSDTAVSYTFVKRLSNSDSDGTSAGSPARSGSAQFEIINRLRPLAAQVQAFLTQRGIDDLDTRQADSLSAPPVAVGTTLDGTSSGITIAPDVLSTQQVSFPSVAVASRVDGLRLQQVGSNARIAPALPGDPNPNVLNVPFEVGTQTRVLAHVPASAKAPFDPLPAGDVTVAPGYLQADTGAFTTSDLRYVKPQITSEDGYFLCNTIAGTETKTLKITAFNLGTPSTASVESDFKGVAGGTISDSTLSVVVNGLLFGGSQTLVRSLVVSSSDSAGGAVVTKANIVVPGSLTSDTRTVAVALLNRGLPFQTTVEAFSGPNGTGVSLGKVAATPNVVLSTVTANNVTTATFSGTIPFVLTYPGDGLRYPSGKLRRGATYTPELRLNSVVPASGYATFSATADDKNPATTDPNPNTLIDLDAATGVFKVKDNATASVKDTPIQIVATPVGSTVTTVAELLIGPNQAILTASNVPARESGGTPPYGIRGTFKEATTNEVTQAILTGATPTATAVLANRGRDYAVAVELTANDDATGAVLSRVNLGSYSFASTSTATATYAANFAMGNLVTAVKGAQISGNPLEGFSLARGKTYVIEPTLTITDPTLTTPTTYDAAVPIRLLSVAVSNGALSYSSLTGVLTVTGSSTVNVNATITLTYKFGPGAGDKVVSTPFNVIIVPATGSVGGTVG